jgi:altronate dehydratase
VRTPLPTISADTPPTHAAMALQLHPRDDVATALRALPPGQLVHVQGLADGAGRVLLRDPIGLCHKFALHAIARGALVHKYGEAIGHATCDIQAGEHVHTHNLKSNRAA